MRPLNGYSISDTSSAILAEYNSNGAGNGSDLGDASSIATSDASAFLSVSNATLLGTTLGATITDGYNISDTAVHSG